MKLAKRGARQPDSCVGDGDETDRSVYTNMIAPVTDAFKYLTALSFDALTFVVIEKLAEGREKLKEDGQNVALWLQALATFAATSRANTRATATSAT